MPGPASALRRPLLSNRAPSARGPLPSRARLADRQVRVAGGPAIHELVEERRQVPQLVEMRGREPAQPPSAVGGQPDSRHPAVLGVAPALHQPCRRRPVHQLDRAVMTQQQVTGEITDGGMLPTGVALDRYQQLMLGRSETNRTGLRLAPVQEAAQAGAEGQQVLEIALGQFRHPLTVCLPTTPAARCLPTTPAARCLPTIPAVRQIYRATIKLVANHPGFPGGGAVGKARDRGHGGHGFTREG